jgi:hypothetical protein
VCAVCSRTCGVVTPGASDISNVATHFLTNCWGVHGQPATYSNLFVIYLADACRSHIREEEIQTSVYSLQTAGSSPF